MRTQLIDPAQDAFDRQSNFIHMCFQHEMAATLGRVTVGNGSVQDDLYECGR